MYWLDTKVAFRIIIYFTSNKTQELDSKLPN